MTEQVMKRLVSGEELQGVDAAKLLQRLLTAPWQVWVALALLRMRQGHVDEADAILVELLNTEEVS